MRRARLHADLRQSLHSGRQISIEAVHVRAQLFHGAVVRSDLADLSADGHRHARGLELANSLENVDADFVVQPLLFVERSACECRPSVDVSMSML